MKDKIKKIGSWIYKVLIAIQLALSPSLLYADSSLPPELTQAAIEKANEVLENVHSVKEAMHGEVLSLREHLLSDLSDRRGFPYKSHTLDVFGLINQTGYEKGAALADFPPYKVETKHENSNKTSIHQQTQSEVASLENPEENKAVNRFFKSPKVAPPRPRDLLFEVYNSNNKLLAVLSHGERELYPDILSEDIRDKYIGRHFIVPAESADLYSFKISYAGTVLHTFPQNLSWIATVGDYLLFLEPSMVSEKKAMLSFIDLKYFTPALGKTALPLFRMPVHLEMPENFKAIAKTIKNLTEQADRYGQIKRADVNVSTANGSESLTSPLPVDLSENKVVIQPDFIEHKENYINIGGFNISKEQLDLLSRLQQLHWNLMVSTVDPTEGRSLEGQIIKTALSRFEKNQIGTDLVENNTSLSDQEREQYKAILSFIEKSLSLKSSMGSTQRPAGQLSKLVQAKNTLQSTVDSSTENEEVKNLYHQVSDILDNMNQYEKVIKSTQEQEQKKRTLSMRISALWVKMMRPRPLGAPFVKQSLGFLAGTLLKGESLKNRVEFLKEFMARWTSKRLRGRGALSVYTVAGLHAILQTEPAEFYYQAFSSTREWGGHTVEILTTTITKSFNFMAWGTHSWEKYITNGHLPQFMIGLLSVLVATYGSFAILHFLVNCWEYIQSLKRPEVIEHNNKVRQIRQAIIGFSKAKAIFDRDNLIFYVNNRIDQYSKDLALSFLTQLGFHTQIVIPASEKQMSKMVGILSTPDYHELLGAFQSQKPITLKMTLTEEDKTIQTLVLKSVNDGNKDTISINISNSKNITFLREFKMIFGDWNHFIDNQGDIKPNYFNPEKTEKSISVEFIGTDFLVKGNLLSSRLSDKDQKRVDSALVKAGLRKTIEDMDKIQEQAEKQQAMMDNIVKESTLHTPAQTLTKAMLYIFTQPVFYDLTFTFSGLKWNWFLNLRQMVQTPIIAVKRGYFLNLFNIHFNQNHIGTLNNGAYEPRWNRVKQWGLSRLSLKSHQERENFLEATKEFEKQVIEIERLIRRKSINIAYFDILSRAVEDPAIMRSLSLGQVAPYRQTNEVQPTDFRHTLPKKEWLRFEVHWRALFKEGMKDFFKRRFNIEEGLSDKETKKQLVLKLQANPELNLFPESEKETEDRLYNLNDKLKLAEKSKNIMNNFFSGFKIRHKTRSAIKVEENFDPQNQKPRFKEGTLKILPPAGDTTKRVNRTKEGLRRADRRATASRFAIIESLWQPIPSLVFTLLILSTVDEGILKVLHEEKFSEEAFFHFGRVALWSGFVAHTVLGMLTATWFKVQMDALQKYDSIPTQEDIKNGYLKWYVNQWRADDNKFRKHYKDSFDIIKMNLVPGFLLYMTMYLLTLGRFDLDLYLIGLALSIGFSPIARKFEVTLEKTMPWVLKSLIKKGNLDLGGKDNHLMADPRIQAILQQRGISYRFKFNVWTAVPAEWFGILLEVFSSVKTTGLGDRALQKLPFGYTGPTQHLFNGLNWMEDKGVPLAKPLKRACQRVFAHNRSDITGLD